MAGGHAWQGDMCGRRAYVAGGHVWPGACVAGGMHGRGVHGRGHVWWGACTVGGMCGRGACVPQQILQDTVNQRAVRILLECILVSILFMAFEFIMLSHEFSFNSLLHAPEWYAQRGVK